MLYSHSIRRLLCEMCVCLLLPFFSIAQTQITRVEFLDASIDYYKCISLKENGLLLKTYNPSKPKNKKVGTFTYELYDTTLQKKNAIDVNVPLRHATHVEYTTSGNHYVVSYKISGEYEVAIISSDTEKVDYLHGNVPKNSIISSIRVSGDYLYLLGYTKSMPLLFIQNIKTSECTFGKIIPLNKNRFSIVSFEVCEKTGEVFLFTKDFLRNENIVKFHSFKDGVKLEETIIKSTESEKYISSAYASRLEDGSLLFVGTYNNANVKKDISVGVFVMKRNTDGKVEFTKYINYLDIQNFTSYLSQRKQEKIEKKQEKLEARQKELEYNYYMVPHNIIENKNEFVIVGEAYFPTYREECQYISIGNGQTMQCYPVFDGYQYTHFFLLGLDSTGNLSWSNSEPMYITEKPFSLMQYLSVTNQSPYVHTMYSTREEIYTFSYNHGNLECDEVIPFTEENEQLVKSINKCRYWYENTFFAYGQQKIKNKDDKTKRDIFFIEKIDIQTDGTH